MSKSELKYRPNVAGILRDVQGKILVCERLNEPGAWQFPQGGVDDGESHEEALLREIWEEIGVPAESYRIVLKRGPYFYEFGDGRTKKGFHGKEQHFFLCDMREAEPAVNVATEHPEFRAFQWIEPRQFQLGWLAPMKHEMYRTVLLELFAVKI